MKDKELVEMFLQRDENAIAQAKSEYQTYCVSIAQNILQSREDSEECVSDALLAAWNSIPPNKPDNIKAYLGKITRNLSFSRLRKQKAKRRGGGEITLALEELSQCLPGKSDVAKVVEDAQLGESINRFLLGCSARERSIFIRRYWYVDSVKSIAKRFSTSPNAVKMSLFRTRNKLKAFLEKEGIIL